MSSKRDFIIEVETYRRDAEAAETDAEKRVLRIPIAGSAERIRPWNRRCLRDA